MAIAEGVKTKMLGRKNSGIRSMFESGLLLKQQFGTENVYDFSLGNPDSPAPQLLSESIRQVAADIFPGCHAYMQNAGLPACRKFVADRVSDEQKTSVSSNHIIMSSGAAGALNVFLKAVLNPEDRVFASVPFFPEYAHYVDNHAGVFVPVPCQVDMSLDIRAFEKAFLMAIDEKKNVTALILNSPNNPSGKVYTAGNIAGLISVIKAYTEKTGKKPYLICDEPYRDIVYDNTKVTAVFPLYDESLVISSFAKNFSLPGERIGYIALNPTVENAAELFQACSFTNRILGFVNAPAFFQRVIAKAENIRTDCSAYEKKRRLIIEVADNAGLTYIRPEGAFYLFCKVPEFKSFEPGKYKKSNDDFAFCTHLQQYRILCVPGSVFGCPGWFRAAYCTDEKTIIHSKEALKKACEEW